MCARTGSVLVTLGRRVQNLGSILEVADGWRLRRAGLNARAVIALRQKCRMASGPPNTILDVGAHRGEFLRLAAAAFPDARIHCFEPVAASFAELTTTAAEIGPHVQCHQIALGTQAGEVEINVNSFTAASSIFQIGAIQTGAFPKTRNVSGVERVRSESLDSWAANRSLDEPILLKLDVQGAELEVLRGATRLLRADVHVLAEISFDDLYVGAPLGSVVMSFLEEHGFRLANFLDEIRDPADGRLLQADAFFMRRCDAQQEG
jgi:FkbM family methyltransferase